MECLETNKVCSNKSKCDRCILDDCKGAMIMLEIQERKINKEKEDKLRARLPKECSHCSFLEIRDLNKQEVYCFYKMNGKCLLNKKR